MKTNSNKKKHFVLWNNIMWLIDDDKNFFLLIKPEDSDMPNINVFYTNHEHIIQEKKIDNVHLKGKILLNINFKWKISNQEIWIFWYIYLMNIYFFKYNFLDVQY